MRLRWPPIRTRPKYLNGLFSSERPENGLRESRTRPLGEPPLVLTSGKSRRWIDLLERRSNAHLQRYLLPWEPHLCQKREPRRFPTSPDRASASGNPSPSVHQAQSARRQPAARLRQVVAKQLIEQLADELLTLLRQLLNPLELPFDLRLRPTPARALQIDAEQFFE